MWFAATAGVKGFDLVHHRDETVFSRFKEPRNSVPWRYGAVAGKREEEKKKAGRLNSRRITIQPVRCLGNLCILSKFFLLDLRNWKQNVYLRNVPTTLRVSFLWDLFIENDFIWKHFGLSHFYKNRSEQWIFYRLCCSGRTFGFEPLFSVSHIIVKILCYTLGIKPITVPWGSSTS